MTPTLRQLISALLLGCLMVSASSAQAQWGGLKGQFVYDGKAPEPKLIDANKDPQVCKKHPLYDEELVVDAKSGGVANIVIYVRTKDVPIAPAYEKLKGEGVVMDNKMCRFEPHVAALWVGQKLLLANSDAVGHNSNVQHPFEPTNPLLPPGAKIDHDFTVARPIPVPVSCNIHPWMKGWVLVSPSPYFAVTDKDGKFEIKDLPAQELEFQFWQEKAGYLIAKPDWERGRTSFKIKAGETTDLGTLKLSPKLFEK